MNLPSDGGREPWPDVPDVPTSSSVSVRPLPDVTAPHSCSDPATRSRALKVQGMGESPTLAPAGVDSSAIP